MRKRTDLVTFRHSGAIIIAAILGLFGALPLALSHWYLTPVLLIPVLVGLWAVRAGVDVNPTGLLVRHAFGSRRIAWADVMGFAATGNRMSVTISNGDSIPLPAVRPWDIPRIMAAGEQEMSQEDTQSEGAVTLTV